MCIILCNIVHLKNLNTKIKTKQMEKPLHENQAVIDQSRRFELSKYFMGITLKKIEAPESIDYNEIAEDAVTAADALIKALSTLPEKN